MKTSCAHKLLLAAASKAGAKPDARPDAEAAAKPVADPDPEADPQNSMVEEYGYDDYNYGAGAGEYEDDYYGKIHQILEPSK